MFNFVVLYFIKYRFVIKYSNIFLIDFYRFCDLGWYSFDVTDAVNRWLTVKSGKNLKAPKISNQLMLEKGRMAVVKKGITSLNSNSTKKLAEGLASGISPEGVFENASLYVYSEDAKHKSTREKRAASNRRGHTSRQRSRRRKGHYNCRRHKQYVDFMEVIEMSSKRYIYTVS